jgi:hypothetical protein
MNMAKTAKARDYTHSVWSGKKYDRPQTNKEMVAESMKVLRNHPTIGRAMKCDDEMMRKSFGISYKAKG